MAPLLIILPFGPFLAWKRGDVVAVTQRLAGAAGLAIFVLIVGMIVLPATPMSLAPLGLLLGIWVAFGAIAELIDRAKLGRVGVRRQHAAAVRPAAHGVVDGDRAFRAWA